MAKRGFRVKYQQADNPECEYTALEQSISYRGGLFAAFEQLSVIGDKMTLTLADILEHYEVEAVEL